MREIRIWPQDAAKCYKNAGKFFPDVRWAKILIEYYFKIKYIKGINNIKVDIFSRKAEL